MQINSCKMTEDLYPLYIDNLLSPESRQFVEDHLNQCAACRKKLDLPTGDWDFSIPLSLDEQAEGAKYDAAGHFVHKIRRRLRNSLILVVVLLLMVSSVSFYYGEQNSGETPLKVASATDYAQKTIPGWNRAEQAGLIQPLGITKPIPGTNATVTFEKVWYTKNYTFVLYTVKEPKRQYYFASRAGLNIPPSPNLVDNPSMVYFINRLGGISPSGLHQVLVFGGYSPPVPYNKLTLTITGWLQVPFSPNDYGKPEIRGQVAVTLPLKDEYLKDSLQTVNLNQQMNFRDHSLSLKKLEVGWSETKLYGQITLQPGETFPDLNGALKCGDQAAYFNSFEALELTNQPHTYTFIATAPPLNQWPAKLELQIKELSFRTATTLSFPFSWSKYQNTAGDVILPDKEQISRTFYDGAIKLWQVNGQSRRGVTFKVVRYSNLQKYPILINAHDLGPKDMVITNEEGKTVLK